MAAQYDVWKDAWRCWQRAAGPLPASITPPLSIFSQSFLRLICLLQFLLDQLLKRNPYFTSFSLSALLSLLYFPSFITVPSAAKLSICVPPVFSDPQLLSPLSPGSSAFAYHLSVLAVQAADPWQQVVFTGQYLLAHKCLLTSRQSPMFEGETHL